MVPVTLIVIGLVLIVSLFLYKWLPPCCLSHQARVLQSQVDTWKNSCMERDQRLEALASRLREQQQSYAALEEHFDQELMAQTKLTELYKVGSSIALGLFLMLVTTWWLH